MPLILNFNKILSRFSLEIVNRRDLDKLVYAASVNRNIKSPQASSMPDPFDDQKYLVKKSSPVIFDVGSYVGEIACKYAKNFPDASIYAFEPTPTSYNELEKKTHKINNIQIFNFALSDTNNKCQFYLNKFSPTNSMLAPSSKAHNVWGNGLVETQETINVDCTTLDEFCKYKHIDHIDILKIDVQGGELNVLRGANDILKDGRIDLIYTEIIFAETYQNQITVTDLLKFMDSSNFQLFNFYNPKYLNRRLIQADLIFVNQNLVK